MSDSQIQILNSDMGAVSLQAFESKIKELQSMPFMGDVSFDFCEALSNELMRLPGVRSFPEIIALAFWLRKGELLRLKATQSGVRKARGLAFHVPPSNVDTIFLYSWIISVLCGNCNVVRISNRAGRATQIILAALDSVCQKGFESIRQNNLFVKYPHDENILAMLSRLCDLRIVWGGDQTVRSVRNVPVAPRALDIGFADRFSGAVFNVSKVLSSSEEELHEVCMNFYNDSYLFNQKACSSPKVIFWVGDEVKATEAKKRFFAKLNVVLDEKKVAFDEAVSMYKLKSAYFAAISDEVLKTSVENAKLVHHDMVGLNSLDTVRSFDFGGGAFCSIRVDGLVDIKKAFTKKDQTLSYYGFSKEEMEAFAQEIEGGGVDRIVPIGSALKFNVKWDGLDLIQTFSREIHVE